MFDKPFKDMLFTIYNFADEERYTYNLSKLGYDSNIDNLEFAILDKVEGVNLIALKELVGRVAEKLRRCNIKGVNLLLCLQNKG